MKLKEDFLIKEIEGTQFLVPMGEEGFNGIVRSNKTAAFIVDCLKEETTMDEIVDAMCAKYDAPKEVIIVDVSEILDILRSINVLDE